MGFFPLGFFQASNLGFTYSFKCLLKPGTDVSIVQKAYLCRSMFLILLLLLVIFFFFWLELSALELNAEFGCHLG